MNILKSKHKRRWKFLKNRTLCSNYHTICVNYHLSRLTNGKVLTKGSNPVVSRKPA